MRGPRTRAEWLFTACVLGQLVVLYAPHAPSTGDLPDLDKMVHLTVFAVVVTAGRRARVAPALVLLVGVLQAPVSELVQHWALPGRTGDPLDVVADLVGCAFGWWLARRRPLRGEGPRRRFAR